MREAEGWRISGTYYESCNCDAVCPCRRQNGKRGSRSTFGICQFLLSWRILRGFAEGIDLAGRDVAMAGFYDNDEIASPWSVVLYIDEAAGEGASAALAAIFLGRKGGSILFTSNIANVIAVRRAAVALHHAAGGERISVRDFGWAEVERPVPYEGVLTCAIPGHDHPGKSPFHGRPSTTAV